MAPYFWRWIAIHTDAFSDECKSLSGEPCSGSDVCLRHVSCGAGVAPSLTRIITTLGKNMFKETPSSLRRYFALVAFLCLIASLSQVAVLFLEKTGRSQLSVATFATLLSGLAFAFVAVRFGTLIAKSPGTIKAVLHVSFWADCIVGVSFGRFPSRMSDRFGWVIATVIYMYLLHSVARISDEQKGNVPNQLPDPTSPSVTPPAGAGDAPSVGADH